MDTPRDITIHPSVHQPRLILGADRELVIFLGLISAILVFALVIWWSILLGVALWLVGVALLVRMGKEDPMMRKVYLRHVRYQAFYPAKAGLHLSGVRLPRGWR
jgi:type IV secretory pathway TrbD component